LQCLAHHRHGEGELLAALTLGAAGVTHCERQAVQVWSFVPQRINETISLLVVEMIDLGDLMRDVFDRFGVRAALWRLE
jgi:hypothetical protein